MKAIVRILSLLLLAVATFLVWSIRTNIASSEADQRAVQKLKRTIGDLPLVLDRGRYHGEAYAMNEQMVRSAGADTFASRIYSDSEGHRFQLYIGGNLGNEENFHAPSYCMPAQGWETLEDRPVPFLAYPVDRADPTMRRLRLQYGQQHMLVYYWFQAGAALADHEWWVRIYRSLDLLLGRPLVPALIITVYVPVLDNEQETELAAQEFLRAIGPHLEFALTGEKSQKVATCPDTAPPAGS